MNLRPLQHPCHLRESGFSLVEVLCAILILGIGIVGVTEGIAVALRSTKEAERQIQAALLATSRIESLRADRLIMAGEDEGDFGEASPGYRWKERVLETEVQGLFEIRVRILPATDTRAIYELVTLLFDEPVETLHGRSTTEQQLEHERETRAFREGRTNE
jgi:prepilin-type N-terminal cleavage/methylation domain-containing protein